MRGDFFLGHGVFLGGDLVNQVGFSNSLRLLLQSLPNPFLQRLRHPYQPLYTAVGGQELGARQIEAADTQEPRGLHPPPVTEAKSPKLIPQGVMP